VTAPPRIVAILATRNEEDLVAAVVGDLVEQGIEVYLLDDGSTDRTAEEARPFLGRGLLGIEPLPPAPGDRFSLRRIVARKEALARQLGADWYLNADADEFRESPWGDLSLREGIALVDRMGYDALDFELLDFRPVDDGFRGGDPRPALLHYEPGGALDRLQIRCWKPAGRPVDLVSSGGHEAIFPGRRVFPIRFLLRHYPFRSQAQAERKLFGDRRPRYDPEEAAAGWHRQYASIEPGHRFVRDPATLVRFDPEEVRARLAIRNRLVEELERAPGAADAQQISLMRERDLLGAALDERNRRTTALERELDDSRREATRQHDEGLRLAAGLDARNREVERLRAERDRLGEELDGRNREILELSGTLDARNREVERLRAERDRLGEELDGRNREAERLRAEGDRLGEELDERNREAERLRAERDLLGADLDARNRETERLRAERDLLGVELDARNREADRLRAGRDLLGADLDARNREVERLRAERAAVEAELVETRLRIERLLTSRSWRWTAPVRALLGERGGRS
jgi:chromosome segregation ATPase